MERQSKNGLSFFFGREKQKCFNLLLQKSRAWHRLSLPRLEQGQKRLTEEEFAEI
jgi:hypothetical protein